MTKHSRLNQELYRNVLWGTLRYLYACFFIFFAFFMIIGFGGHLPGSAGPQVNAFLGSLRAEGFVEPLLIIDYLVGGIALCFSRTAPLAIIALAPAVVMIFLFHIFDTHLLLWGSIWPIGLALLAWRFRSSLLPLWNWRGAV